MSSIDVPLRGGGFGSTERKDAWWVTPLFVFLALAGFIAYATWAAFQNGHYRFGPYLSPFYSPEILGDPLHAWFGAKPGWWPGWLPFSPALLILPVPAGFRFTCYYYRGAYYKAFWADPPACGVGEPNRKYRGERSLPLIYQNIHRYFLYLSIVFILFLFHDAWLAFWFADGFGVRVGSLVLLTNPILLGGYTFGCHSLRHLVGGRVDEMSKSPARKTMFDCVTCLNRRHLNWAWPSVIWVAFTDLYVRLCSMGIWTDWRIF